MRLELTPLMRKRFTEGARQMIARSLDHFPELDGRIITVGYTRKHLGSASIVYRRGAIERLIIRLKVRKLTYQTIGHELTHLVQALTRGERPDHAERIPGGEKQCDIWTLARHALFCDDAPSYLKMPRPVRERWPEYADAVRGLCIAAIDRRPAQRLYIRWLETEMRRLGAPHQRKPGPAQLTLPFPRLSARPSAPAARS